MCIKNDIQIIDETDKADLFIGLTCPVCEYILCSHDDIYNMRKNNCCNECYLTFGEARKDDWLQGWRPDKDKLDRYKQQRRILNIRLDDILGD